MIENIWIFNGADSRFASGAFDDIKKAEEWISTNKLTGTLTNYPVNIGVYHWAIENEFFSPKKKEHTSPEFIGKFSSASQEHFHYEEGKRG
ncbi:hypothetical protein CLV51_102267 [Chitinophaga niastensis]|uniref:DUF7710 domain-containing protein n=1 Tax=Chitinophaga niastensis TaxID=536980 RepID=A0A2P8HMI7_CHINA|nr:hypothetical protein [Chitinophaga niastensis]PSL47420.1 hypothetical protein CLV51_102267 [Chitinophaga niastensis]